MAFDETERPGVPLLRLRLLFMMALSALNLALAAAPAAAQIGLPGGLGNGLPQTPGLPGGLPTRNLPIGHDALEGLARDGLEQVLQAPSRLRGVIRRSEGALEADPAGWPVVRGELVAVDLSPQARERALAAGFAVVREERFDGLDMTTVVLAPPRRLSLRRALERLRDLDPDGSYAFNHVHTPAGEIGGGGTGIVPAAPAPAPPQRGALRIGLIDTGVDVRHPALAGERVVQRGFAGAARAAPHGTAVASLLVGRAGAFSGAAPGGDLYAADVYGASRAGGSSTGLVQALAWMVENDVPVVNISLVGPRNAVVEAAVRRAASRGLLIVAAVGNDGPAAAPLYPAAYPDVVGVTAVNSRGRVLPEAARGPQVDLAAPGADMAAAGSGQGYVSVRGSSFAAPLAAGLLARRMSRPDSAGAAAALAAVARAAVDAGPSGPDPVYGQGVVAVDRRISPATVGARGRLTR